MPIRSAISEGIVCISIAERSPCRRAMRHERELTHLSAELRFSARRAARAGRRLERFFTRPHALNDFQCRIAPGGLNGEQSPARRELRTSAQHFLRLELTPTSARHGWDARMKS